MEKSYPTTFQKIISIILGTLVMGFMWRCRGDGGFGIFSSAVILLLLIYQFYGKHTGMKYEMNKKMYRTYFAGFNNYLGIKPVEFSKKAFVGYFYLSAFAYFFLGCGYIKNFPYEKISGFGSFIYVMLNEQQTITAMICSLIIISILYWPIRKKLK